MLVLEAMSLWIFVSCAACPFVGRLIFTDPAE